MNATRLNVVPVARRAAVRPMRAKGMENMMIRGCRRDSNWLAMIT